MFNQRSAFDEALSRPLVPAADEGGVGSSGAAKKSKKKNRGKIGTSGRGAHSPPRSSATAAPSAVGRLPSFGPASGNNNETYAPPSAVSSVVSEDDVQAAAGGFDPSLSSTFETSHGQRQQQMELEHESLDEALLRERNTAIAEVTRNMGLVHTIQRELSTLVSSQQEDIDDIESNAVEVHEATDRGVEQLERARHFIKDGCGSKWGGAVLTSVGGTSVVAALVFWLLAN